MKKAIAVALVLMAFMPAMARHHHGYGHYPHHGYHHYHHHHHHSGWAAVGVGLAAGAVGAALYNAVAPRETVVGQQPAPVVVQQPVVVQPPAPVVVQQPAPVVVQQPVARQQVWVEGRYVDQVQPNGSAVRVWQPGHYE